MSATTSKKARLSLEGLGERVVPAQLSGGHVTITGTAAADKVDVSHFTDRGVEYLSVVQNGTSQKFKAKDVTQINFFGNNGNDTFKYTGTRGVYADGGAGTDTLQGGSGNDLLLGGADGDKIYGGAGTNRLEGGAGNDFLYGYGGSYNTMLGNDGNDFFEGGSGTDLILGNAGNDTLRGWGGNDELQGGEGDDILFGGSGNDRLFGQAGNDALMGEDGDDAIVGGTGLDYAFGGAGKDQFWEVATDTGLLPRPLNTTFGKVVSYGVQDFNAVQGDVKNN